MTQVTYHQVSNMPCFVVFTDWQAGWGDVDIVLHSKESAQKHAKELKNKYGCEGVKVKEFENEATFWAIADKK